MDTRIIYPAVVTSKRFGFSIHGWWMRITMLRNNGPYRWFLDEGISLFELNMKFNIIIVSNIKQAQSTNSSIRDRPSTI